MRLMPSSILLVALAAALPAKAQQHSVAADTTGREEQVFGQGIDRYYRGTLTKADGTRLQAYLPTKRRGYKRRLTYLLPPLSDSSERWQHYGLCIKAVKSVAVHDRLYETIELAGKPTKVLALRVLDGPVALATYVEPRAIVLPLPLDLDLDEPLLFFPLSDKQHWYLRRNGVWTEMRRAHFAQLMSAYLADNPTLAGKVARQEPGYQHRDTPALIAEYNRAKSSRQ